jgi:hypothetical protein
MSLTSYRAAPPRVNRFGSGEVKVFRFVGPFVEGICVPFWGAIIVKKQSLAGLATTYSPRS